MRCCKVTDKGNDSLIIFFSGWSTDETCFNIEFEGYDSIIFYDYRELNFMEASADIDFEKYKRIVLMAWSFGVRVADDISKELPKTSLNIALCGSLLPIDDNFGIPVKAFEITLKSIERTGIDKFNIRMCNGRDGFFSPSKRALSEQVEELTTLRDKFLNNVPIYGIRWDRVIIGSDDLIFPSNNLNIFWDKKSIFAPINAQIAHLPFCDRGMEEIRKILNEI